MAQVEHFPSSVGRVDEVEEAVLQHVHLIPSLGERDRLVVAARLWDHDVVLAGERAAGRVKQADPPVIAPVHHNVLSRPGVTKEQELKVQVEQVRHSVERRLRQRICGAQRDDVAQVRPLAARSWPVPRFVGGVRERALDRPPIVTQRHRYIRYAAHLPVEATGGLLRRLRRAAASGVRS